MEPLLWAWSGIASHSNVSVANVARVKQQLADHEVMVEEYGGSVVSCEVSAKKREGIDMQLTAENEKMKRQIDAFEAQTDRLDTQIDAQKAGADISHKRTDEFGKKIENTAKIIQLKKAEIDMTDDELFGQIMAG